MFLLGVCMDNKVLVQMEKESFLEQDAQEIPPGDIVAYNELRSCADLYRMFEDGSLDISPAFQRDVVWASAAQTRFVDSLIKQLPIPSLCFAYDYKTEEWQVIDGLQRISSIIKFLDKKPTWILSSLPDIDPRIAGIAVADFHVAKTELNKLKRRIENSTLPITVIRCDPSLQSHSDYLFTIFHRLNTGGTKLNNQEIRNCIYSGSFNQLLKDLDPDKNWLAINAIKVAKSDRFRRQEIILRFFAFGDGYEKYTEGLARFLNEYMRRNRHQPPDYIASKRALFEEVVSVINDKLGDRIADDRLNLALLEALLVGVGRNVKVIAAESKEKIVKRFDELKANEEFSEMKLVEGLSKTARVLGRMNAATKIFG